MGWNKHRGLVADLSHSSLSEASSAEFRVMRTLVMVPWVLQGCPFKHPFQEPIRTEKEACHHRSTLVTKCSLPKVLLETKMNRKLPFKKVMFFIFKKY